MPEMLLKERKPKAHVSPVKKEAVKRLAALGNSYSIIGIIEMDGLPANVLQKMRGLLRGKVEFAMTRRTLLKLAMEQLRERKQNLAELEKHLGRMPALIFTKEDPFRLYKVIKKNKAPAAIKAGQKAPYDIIVPAGPTPFMPGPIISEFSALKIKAGVEGGKIAVKEDALVAKAGDVVSDKLASMLQKLSIFPMEIGLNLVAVYDNGMIYTKDALDFDEEKLTEMIIQAAHEAINLSVEAGIFSRDIIETIIAKGWREAAALEEELKAKGFDAAQQPQQSTETSTAQQLSTPQQQTSTAESPKYQPSSTTETTIKQQTSAATPQPQTTASETQQQQPQSTAETTTPKQQESEATPQPLPQSKSPSQSPPSASMQAEKIETEVGKRLPSVDERVEQKVSEVVKKIQEGPVSAEKLVEEADEPDSEAEELKKKKRKEKEQKEMEDVMKKLREKGTTR